MCAAASTRRAGAGAGGRGRGGRAAVPGRPVDSIFFGGGTPSLMPPETVAAIIAAIAAGWTLAPDAEITLEANPTSVEAGRFRGYRDAGVNRLSLGVQALDDADLRGLGRMHDVAEAMRGLRGGAGDLSAGELRPDLCPAGADPRRLAGRAARGRWRWRSTTCRSTS